MITITFSGRHCVEMALQSSFVQIKSIDCTEEFATSMPTLRAKNRSFSLQIRDKKYFRSEEKNQGVQVSAVFDLKKHIEECDHTQWKTVLVLDHLNDPMNVGSAIRHAVAFGVDAVIIPKYQSAPISSTVIHASSGAVFSIPIIQPPSFGQCLELLKKMGFGLIGTTLSDRSEVFHSNVFWDKTALVIGNEGQGISQGVAQKCDSLITIPMSGRIQSLNAAITSAILCYERFKSLS